MSCKNIFRKCTGVYKITKSQEKVNQHIYHEAVRKNEKKKMDTQIEKIGIYCLDIGTEFDIRRSHKEKWKDEEQK